MFKPLANIISVCKKNVHTQMSKHLDFKKFALNPPNLSMYFLVKNLLRGPRLFFSCFFTPNKTRQSSCPFSKKMENMHKEYFTFGSFPFDARLPCCFLLLNNFFQRSSRWPQTQKIFPSITRSFFSFRLKKPPHPPDIAQANSDPKGRPP